MLALMRSSLLKMLCFQDILWWNLGLKIMVSHHKVVILSLHLLHQISGLNYFIIWSDAFAAIISVVAYHRYFCHYTFFLVTDAFTQSSNEFIFFLQIGRHSNLKLSMSGCKIIMALLISFQWKITWRSNCSH